MNSKTIRNMLLLLITALIWGSAFVAQSEGGNALGPYTFNAIRSFIGTLALLPLCFMNGIRSSKEKSGDTKTLWIGGVFCGLALAVASNLQQLGLFLGSTPGKAGFLTACYIIIVPLLGLFFHRKCHLNIWVSVLIALIGLYLLCCKDDSLSFHLADLLLLGCALIFSIHILIIDHFSPLVSGVRMSCIQFFICGLLSSMPMIFYEIPEIGIGSWLQLFGSQNAWTTLLYAGVMSCGVAYTLQIIGQEGVHPTIASLIMSLESVFAVIAGWLILGDALSRRELYGCILMFFAIVLAQLPLATKKE